MISTIKALHLGTAVAAHLVAHLSQLCGNMGHGTMPQPSALILEAPFNNLIEEIESHPFSKVRMHILKYTLRDTLSVG